MFQVWFHNFKSKLLNQYFGIEKRFYIGWKRWTGFVKRVSFQTFNLSCRWYILSDCLRFLWTGVLALDVLRCLSIEHLINNHLWWIRIQNLSCRTIGSFHFWSQNISQAAQAVARMDFFAGFLFDWFLAIFPVVSCTNKMYIPCIKPFQASDIIHCRIYRVIQSDSHKWICYFMTLYPCLIDF